ncbi:MAG TPA: site-2 protease family protein [Actinomycetota bacterium]|nr:site-2 protease family protein [Actinomycetota bacterium]
MESLKFAVFLAIGLAPSLILHEYAHAFAADRLGDPSPRRWGRLSLNPRPMIDPFGSLILPGLVLVLVATGNSCLLPIFAYAKPMPLDPHHLRNPKRDAAIVTLAGLGANLVLAIAAGLALRAGIGGDLGRSVYALFLVNVYMFVFQLMPVPGLDGAKLLAPALPPRAREVYANLDHYLVLFILVIFFLLAGPLLAIVRALAQFLTELIVGIQVPIC